MEDSNPQTQRSPIQIRAGLIGASIQQSRSPFMHESEAASLGLRLSYSLIDLKSLGLGVDALPKVLDEVEAGGFAGVNITHPFKQAVIPLLGALSDEAAMIGAVNTVVFDQGVRRGYNTDASGFGKNFHRRMAGARLDRVVQLGAGGAGAATAYAMLELGAERLTVVDVDPARARALAGALDGRFGPGRVKAADMIEDVIAAADGLVHATPTGMDDYPGLPLAADLLRRELWVAEIVYFPLETQLLRVARAAGCKVLDGGGMAVMQAAEAFELFTGVSPDVERMLRRFQEG